MFEDDIKTKGWDGAMQVKDVSELIVAALPKDTAAAMGAKGPRRSAAASTSPPTGAGPARARPSGRC